MGYGWIEKETNTIIIVGTSPDTGGTANTSTRIELDSNASSVDGAYDPAEINIVDGTGSGQSRQIWEYDGTNKYAYVNRDWKVTPDNTSVYRIRFHSGDHHVNEGVAQGGTNNTITLNILADSQNNIYLGQCICIMAGTGTDQARMVITYNGTTKVATVDADWIVNPDTTSVYAMIPFPGFIHGRPAADGTDNILMRDVIGNRTDGHATTTLKGDHHMFHDHFHHVAKVIPSGTAAAQVTCGDAQAWDLGEFAVIAATNAIDDDFDVHFINVEAMSANATYELVLYSGADASEVEVGRIRFVKTAGQTKAEGIPFGTPMIAVNTQIKAKVMSSSGNADTIDITIHYHDY